MENWSNNACLGYLVKAMENAGYSSDDIQVVVSETNYLFDSMEVKEAAAHYERSVY